MLGAGRRDACRSRSSAALQMERLRATLRERLRQRALLPQEARRGRHQARRRRPATATSPICPSRPRSTCATTTRSACSRGRATRSCACTPAPARPATRPPSATRAPTSTTWGDLIARTLAAGGVEPGDLLQNAYGYGLFTGGLGLHFGAELPRLHGRADLRRQHRAPAQDHARLRRHRAELHAVVRHVPGRRRPRPRPAPRRPAGARRLPRRRALDQRAAPADRGRPRHRRPRHLRALRDGRPRRRLRVPVQGRHARQRGPLPGRDRRPRDAAAAARGRGRRARVHHAHAARRSRSSATARATSAASSPSRAPAAAPRRA